ncbi:MAG: hypothetical protein ACOC1K_03875 [Nanoarchaeota archaeon]
MILMFIMVEYVRKIQRVGNRSYAVSLPKKWVLENELDKIKNVNIVENDNNLILSSNNIKKNNDFVEININKPELIPSIILLCYVKGVCELILKFDNNLIYLKSKSEITKILSYLEGFKIIDEEENKITLNLIYNKSDLKISKLSKRMISIIHQMVDCIVTRQFETKLILEKELDSLYHLSKRILFICSKDNTARFENNIFDLEEIFLWRLIFKRIENIGDVIEKNVDDNDVQIDELKYILKYLENLFIFNKTLSFDNIEKLKNKKYDFLESEKIANLTVDIMNNYLLIILNKKIFAESSFNHSL